MRRHKLALWAIVGAVALAVAWVAWPGVMAWRTRSEVYTAAMRQCLADMKDYAADEARRICNAEVRP
ncbi:hypothetical protein LZ518_11740 [Sphingomonas sp. RB56-2]|uniref:Uncharacterized protein n=1 Tax=Sphingomonas brevis TaxID=2908206 RepID=A0ABT0SBK4_9SPHN|nr:hypothetical protein [Sphingomonas brevis]MCL6741799.1 hypothetical protein [Sphingomonas brevis]